MRFVGIVENCIVHFSSSGLASGGRLSYTVRFSPVFSAQCLTEWPRRLVDGYMLDWQLTSAVLVYDWS